MYLFFPAEASQRLIRIDAFARLCVHVLYLDVENFQPFLAIWQSALRFSEAQKKVRSYQELDDGSDRRLSNLQ